MELERRLAGILTILAVVAIPATAFIIHLPHGQEVDLSALYLSLAAMTVLVIAQNLIIFYPSKHGRLFPRIPPFFVGVQAFQVIVCVAVFFSGGLDSPLYYAALLGPIMSGIYFELPLAVTSTSVLTLLYAVPALAGGDFRLQQMQPLVFNVFFFYLACLLANRLALELRRQVQSKDEVANLGDFIRRLEKAKSEFVSMVSHELRTPLTSIHGFSEILATKDMELEKRKEFYRIIVNESERLSRLITNLLNLSKIEAGIELNREMIDLPDLIEEDLEFFRSQTAAHELKYRGAERLPQVYGDRDRIHQVFSNLLSNAIKYSPEGGTVEVETGVEGKYVTFSVTDHGIGIPGEELPHIFERFRRVENKELSGITGTGLGLAIVKHLVELHGGKITVRSEPGAGSTFTVYVPIRGV